MSTLRFETDRLILRDYEPEDHEIYFKLKSDSQTMYYLQDIQLLSKEEADEDFAGVLQDILHIQNFGIMVMSRRLLQKYWNLPSLKIMYIVLPQVVWRKISVQKKS